MHTFSHPAFEGFCGVARRDITPPLGIYSRNWGAAEGDVAMSVHRPLLLTVLTLEEGSASGVRFALLSLDLGWWRSEKEEKILHRAVQEAGFQDGTYFLALSHTHAGPVFCPGDAGKPGGDRIGPYLEFLSAQIRSALEEALASAQPGILEVSSGECALATHRDFPDPATGRLLVGWNPEAAADQTLLVGRVTSRQGKALATLVNYACHPTILAWENTALSPDYIGSMREVVEETTGAPMLFMQGASGELAARHQYVGDPSVADRAGLMLGHSVLATLAGMLLPRQELVFEGALESGAPLAVWRTRPRASLPGHVSFEVIDVELPLKQDLPSVESYEEAIAACEDRVEGERLQRKLLLRRSLGPGPCYTTRHLIWQLGEIAFVSVANEVYSRFQTSLRESAGRTPLFVATLTNGSRGYLADAAVYEHNGYAAWQSPFAPGCLEDSIKRLHPAVERAATRAQEIAKG